MLAGGPSANLHTYFRVIRGRRGTQCHAACCPTVLHDIRGTIGRNGGHGGKGIADTGQSEGGFEHDFGSGLELEEIFRVLVI